MRFAHRLKDSENADLMTLSLRPDACGMYALVKRRTDDRRSREAAEDLGGLTLYFTTPEDIFSFYRDYGRGLALAVVPVDMFWALSIAHTR